MTEVRFEPPVFRCELPNGDQSIRFEGSVHGDVWLGTIVDRGEVHPLLMTTAPGEPDPSTGETRR